MYFFQSLDSSMFFPILAIVFVIFLIAYEVTTKKLSPISKLILKHVYYLKGGRFRYSVQNKLNFADAKEVNVIVSMNLRSKNTYEYILAITSEEEFERLYGDWPFNFGIAAIERIIATEKVLDAYDLDRQKFEKRLLRRLDEEIFFSGYKVTAVEFNFIDNDRNVLKHKMAEYSA